MAAIALFYFSTLVLMLPLLSCVGIGALWAKRDLPFGGSFITTLVTSVTTPALVFHTFVTTHLDDRRAGGRGRGDPASRCCCAGWSAHCG